MIMKKLLLIIMAASMFLSTSVSAANFNDINGHWAETVINRLADSKVVSGVTATEFSPESSVTRAQYLKMVMNAVGIEEIACEKDMCLDAYASDWYCGYLNSALNKGLIPEDMIENYKAEIIAESSTDADGQNANVIYSGKFNGNSPINREEMSFITMSMYQYILNAKTMQSLTVSSDISFTDKDLISVWAHNGVAMASANGLITGMDDGNFKPKDTATRAQAATIIGRVLDKLEK